MITVFVIRIDRVFFHDEDSVIMLHDFGLVGLTVKTEYIVHRTHGARKDILEHSQIFSRFEFITR